MKIDELISGMKDTLVLTHSTAKEVLADDRSQMIKKIQDENVESVQVLADDLDKDIKAVKKDLKMLYEADIIDFEQKEGGKTPVMRHETVIIEPITLSLSDRFEN